MAGPTELASRPTVSQKGWTRAELAEIENPPMASQKVWTMAETWEPESLPKASVKAHSMGSPKAALTATVLAKASPKELLKLSAKAQTRGFLKAAWTLTVPAKALRKEPLKADRIAMEPGKMMALMKACWKLTVSVKDLTKAGPMELASRPMMFQKVWTRAEPAEPDSPLKTSAKAQRMGLLKVALTAIVPAKASRKKALRADWHQQKFQRCFKEAVAPTIWRWVFAQG
jgi:hypothetical protein